jgi:hypothetical protein
MAVSALAASGVCTLDLDKLKYEETPMGKVLIGEALESKTVSVQIPEDVDPYDYFNLQGSIGEFEMTAMVEPGEKTVSNITLSDKTHMVDFAKGDNLASLSNLQSMQRVTIYCRYVE